MPIFLTSQPVCASVKDYYVEDNLQYSWPKAINGITLFAAREGWMATDENGNAKRISNHSIVEDMYELERQCKRWKAKNHDPIYEHFLVMDTLIFYVLHQNCYVADFASYYGGDAVGEGECIRHKQIKFTGEKIETRYGEENTETGTITWFADWVTPYSEKTEVLKVSAEDSTVYSFYFNQSNNKTIRLEEVTDLSIGFGNGAYPDDYMAELSFDSGAVPTMIGYPDSGILNWVGTDCTMVDGLSIFQPSANTHYDIVFYFNGTQFIGLVNGYVPSVSR